MTNKYTYIVKIVALCEKKKNSTVHTRAGCLCGKEKKKSLIYCQVLYSHFWGLPQKKKKRGAAKGKFWLKAKKKKKKPENIDKEKKKQNR